MKRKYFAVLYILILSVATLTSFIPTKTEALENGEVAIPDQSIRLRILANSDSDYDQQIKRSIRDAVKKDMDKWVQDAKSIEEARAITHNHLPEIKEIAKGIVVQAGAKQSVKAELKEATFPTKLYGDYLYPAGKYEAVVISLGAAEGANWWCVLYPPLCFLDFSTGTAVPNKSTKNSAKKVKVKYASKSIIEKLWK